MSSFICKPETFINVASLIYKVQKLCKAPRLNTVEDINRLIKWLAELNGEGYCERYGLSEVAVTVDEVVEIPDNLDITAQEIKSTHCLLYQCDEGSVPNKNTMFKIVEKCLEIAEQLTGLNLESPQMDDCYWG